MPTSQSVAVTVLGASTLVLAGCSRALRQQPFGSPSSHQGPAVGKLPARASCRPGAR